PRALTPSAIARAVHREQAPVVGQDRRVARTERPAPDDARPRLGPLVGETAGLDDEVAMWSAPLTPRRGLGRGGLLTSGTRRRPRANRDDRQQPRGGKRATQRDGARTSDDRHVEPGTAGRVFSAAC